MIEKIILDYLTATLSVPVAVERAETPPPKYVLIERTGGGEVNHVMQATVAIQAYAQSRYDAAALMQEVIDAMHGILTLKSIGSAKLSTFYNYTDTEEKTYRYQAVYDLVYYREVI